MSRIKHPASVVGNPTKPVQLQQSSTGKDYVSFTLASPTRVKDEAGQWTDDTPVFYRVKAFGRLARRLATVSTKVHLVLVGDLQVESYTDKDGNNRQANTLIVSHAGASLLFHTPQLSAHADQQSAEQLNPWDSEPSQPYFEEEWAEHDSGTVYEQ